jgi:hypothetical protein
MDSSQINDFQQEPIRKVSILLGIGIFVMPYIFLVYAKGTIVS